MKNLGKPSENVTVKPNVKQDRQSVDGTLMPDLPTQANAAKGSRANAGNYEYSSQLNNPVQSLTDKIITLLLKDEVEKLMPHLNLGRDQKVDKEGKQDKENGPGNTVRKSGN